MLNFNDLLFNKWVQESLQAIIGKEVVLDNKLNTKLFTANFYWYFDAYQITTYKYWSSFSNLFLNFPDSWEQSNYERYLATTPKELQVNDPDYLEPVDRVVTRAFHDTLYVWLYLPIFLSDFFKYYPSLKPIPLVFDEREFAYLDSWIKILPVFQDFLGHLLVNDTPLVEVFYRNRFLPLYLKPPIEENIDFSKHLNDYYFGEGSIPEFKDLINLYLDNRLELKTKCLNSFNTDKQLSKQIPDDLAVYFISYFLIKGISNYTLRFLVANLDLSNKNPMKPRREAYVKEWNSFTEDKKKKILTWYLSVWTS